MSLSIDSALGDANLNLSGTHLNLCAIYSRLSKHNKAITHAKEAIRIINRLGKAEPKELLLDENSPLHSQKSADLDEEKLQLQRDEWAHALGCLW
eukprot:CAMPEP_0202961778 /NCGR_PEP_ID=MMETSP1396-20130829/5860_1 /ASSEMBLY_ACC=CAM_ASM_000872 /TAXON_ID= /ORGANISM="Pseudokeronopsis sp., Strain Brazil" /LENGTH=94 /DNA_ID=CAMNT_0049681863 /DNA_START=316 /DNA_END=597 /DNA_ORIENTATION=-